jgi:hypothetical protein
VPGPTLVYLEHNLSDGMNATSSRQLAAELIAAAELVEL